MPQSTPVFVGREDELERLKVWLTQTHSPLLTVTGLGGVGKTELAIKVAKDYGHNFSHVTLVRLEDVPVNATEPEIRATVARAMAIAPSSSRERLTQHIAQQSWLLILDNCEHLLVMSTLVSYMTQACSNLKILVTSRQPLNLKLEQILPLEGLSPLEAATQLFNRLCENNGVIINDPSRN